MSAETSSLEQIWVASDQQLQTICTQLQSADELAMDTEFIRTDTFYPRPALLQISNGHLCYLVDVLALEQLEPLKKLLASGPLKVFHSCSEDLEMLKHWLGVLPQPLVDTQLAAAFALKDPGKGYQRLVEDLLGLQLEKGETRSDWLQRPLTASQKKYAAQDVEFLLPVWHQLKQRLKEQEWLTAVEQESQWLVEEAQASDKDQPWLRLKQAWQLSPEQLLVAQALAKWREEQAAKKDRPRNRIASDSLIHTLACVQPQQLHQLSQLEEASPGWIRRYGDEVVALIAQTAQQLPKHLPEARVSPISKEYKNLRKCLRQALAAYAAKLDLPQEVLAKRKLQDSWLQDLLKGRQPELPERLPAWKKSALQDLVNQLEVTPA